MRAHTHSFLAAILTVTCCLSSLAGADLPSVPIEGVAEGVTVSATPDVNAPWIVSLVVEWEGVASHLGAFERTDWLVVNFITGELTGTKTFTAANGDQLKVVTDGTFDPTVAPTPENPLLISGNYTLAGGTGRFEGATGGATYEVLTPDFINGLLSFKGEISY